MDSILESYWTKFDEQRKCPARTDHLTMQNLPAPMLFDPKVHQDLIPSLVQIHVDCVVHDGTLATFLPDPTTGQMDMEALKAFWRQMGAEVTSGQREIVLQFANKNVNEDGLELAGFASLYMPFSQTGAFRSVVEKLMVSPSHRRKGIARAVMKRIEDVAEERNRGLIVSTAAPLSYEDATLHLYDSIVLRMKVFLQCLTY
jgi:GNAT superfamily N-acetyltransferase